jgi:hypothetical protein
MRRLLPLLVLVPLLGAAEEKSNALTPEEAAEGRLKLFDGETTFGWKIDGEAKVEKGVLILGGTKETKAEVTSRFGLSKLLLALTSEGPVKLVISDREREVVPNKVWIYDGPVAVGAAPVRFDIPAGTRVTVHSARLQPREMTPLFNGKDLTGWKQFTGDPKREKSKFTVADGVLTVKDGPGDLATEKLLDDFVLQLECRSNGKYLNSGIFFRAIPGEYQNGYEAQVQHDFSLETPKKYLVDEYDPATGKKAGTREVLSKAKDFGTIATWVNGVQQVDWTDNRPAHDNPRNGCREKAGAISIQGHDPTTDLSFRNIRHAVLPREKK